MFGLLVIAGVFAAFIAAYIKLVIEPNLPALDALTDYTPKIPLRVYTADNVLIGEFGQEHREYVPLKRIPSILKTALLVTEDEGFYSHGGIAFTGVLRAVVANLAGGGMAQGASTITMQVARNFFLSREKTYTRKLYEVMLAYRIEEALTKDQILELYMNQIYLGQRAYGFASAARTYFGKPVGELTIAESAMLAGLPKAPAANNPVTNPKRARARQQYILQRLRDREYITDAQYRQAVREEVRVKSGGQEFDIHAEYVAETVRQVMYERFKEDTYTRGFNVYTTILGRDQDAAYQALRRNVMDYETRHGYRGPEAFMALPKAANERLDAIDEELEKHPASGELLAAVVLAASPKMVRAVVATGDVIDIAGSGLSFAAAGLVANARPQLRIRPGAVIRVAQDANRRWVITQLPEVAAAIVALDAGDGAYRALVGGFDFNLGKFDHATQAWRQPGSSIKPFIYSAALEKGFAPGTLINDAPLALTTADTGGQAWEPKNDDGYDGPISMRRALAKSKNIVSVRLLRAVGVPYAHQHLERFGFSPDRQPRNLTMTLGTGSVTPLQLAGAYAVFANGGYRVNPYLIRRVTDARGRELFRAKPAHAGMQGARVLDARNAFVMDSMLRDVVRYGTGAMAGQKLGRADIAGKTGTTSDALDGWFSGYGANVVAVAWMGYDDPKSLGSREFGATLALPIWVDYMRVALDGRTEAQREAPAGLAMVDGDWRYQEYGDAGGVRSIGFDDNARSSDAVRALSILNGIDVGK
ncbi:MAG TPA: penicillin-binding protein 1A [Noviherbaspirillum sp.]|nr:penicillin-binding protein 1A [Noviherbaspirillum sp.]